MTTGISNLTGLFKEVYTQKGIIDLIPENLYLTKRVPFLKPASAIGNLFNQPVVVGTEQGVTYAAPGSGAFATNSAISMQMGNAQVNAYQVLLRAAIDMESIARSGNGGKASFEEATKLQMRNVVKSMAKRIELSALYGRSGLGVADSSVNTNTTTTVVTLSVGTFATGIWSGTENAEIQFFDTVTGNLVSSGSDSVFTIFSVDPTNRALTVTGTSIGITALDAALTSTGSCDIYFNSARVSATVWNEQQGLYGIMTNTSSTMFNINAGQYSLWRGNTYSCSGTSFQLDDMQKAVALPFARGGLDEAITLFVSPQTWATLLTDQAALRRYDVSFRESKMVNGAEALAYASQNGTIEVISHPYVKPSQAFGVPMSTLSRIGSTEMTFNQLGNDAVVFQQMANNAGYQYTCYTAQQIFCDSPAKTVMVTDVVN